ncbi:MAG: carbohydrate ABC transporter permease [Chloroflexi bacterium]|nr:carbohydrate ABC transporter permease [Chloroflexota bacterium]
MKAANFIYKAVLYAILLVVILFYLAPILVLLTTSLKPEGEILSQTWEWIPRTITLENYIKVIDQYPFWQWMGNSAIVTAGTLLLMLAVSLPAGYAFARMEFRGKNILFGLSLLTIMIPHFAYIPQLYLMMSAMKMIPSHVSLMIPLATSAVSMFLIRQFITQIPRDMDDAAKIDGCGNWGVFFRIILPLTRPALITAVIFTSIKSWNALLWPLIAATTDTVKTLPVGLATNVFAVTTGISHMPPYGVVMAASFLSIIFPVGLFLILQNYFVQGIATTGLK